MTFTRKNADLTPIEDTVFSVVSKAKQDRDKNGDEHVIDATIGSLCDENGQLTAYQNVFEHYDSIDDRTKAAYASSFSGNPDYREAVWNWVTQNTELHLSHSVIATPGGSGADSTALRVFLDCGQTVILPEIAWGSYKLMASENNIETALYSMFDGDHLNLASIKETVQEVMKKQDRIVIVVNDPCHNPTGYSMTIDEWKELISFLNECSKEMPVILIDDIAYIDYSYDLTHVRDYMNTFNDISDNVMIITAFSCSKTLTSYGLRCGAALIQAQKQESVREAEIVFEKAARATWSNIPNAAMANFVWVTSQNRDAFMQEKQFYIDLMKKRSDLFVSQAKACDLPFYPYKEGFFVTLKIEDASRRDRIHEEFLKNHIYTVKVRKGIRVAICSLPVRKIDGLALSMKIIMDSIQ